MVIENGQMNETNLAKMRLTVDMLEVRLRQQGIENMSDIQWATIESNGQLGYIRKPQKQYATKEDIQVLISMIQAANLSPPSAQTSVTQTSVPANIFTEVENKKHTEEPPDHLK